MEITRWSENQPRVAGEAFYFIPEERELMERPDLTRDQHASPGMIDAMYDRSAWDDRNMSQSDYDQIMAHRRSGLFGPANLEARADGPSAWGFRNKGKGQEWAGDPREFGFRNKGKGQEWAGDPREFGFQPDGKGMSWRGDMPPGF